MDNKLYPYIYVVIIILILVYFYKEANNCLNYKCIEYIENMDDLLVLVNKSNKLHENYVPSDLEPISLNYANSEKYLRRDARINFEKLSDDAKKIGYSIIGVSAYRDYNYQKELYNRYTSTKGRSYADKSSARPGHSEHQTGLAIDVMGKNNDYNLFAETDEFTWMKDNAHRYGFILRYPKGKEKITGFKYEPWHYRYVTKEAAYIIYKFNLTLEEYNEKTDF